MTTHSFDLERFGNNAGLKEFLTGKKTPGLLLEQVKYPRKGIMLDIGHLLHTNTALRTEEDAVKYLREVLGRYEDLSIILGVHYHQTLEGPLSRR